MFKIKSIYINPIGTSSVHKGAADIYRIYKNPNAKELYLKAQSAKTVEERTKLFEQMGEYDISIRHPKNESKNRFIQFLKGILS